MIYIQAKRFANGNKVTRHDLQAFIGAMEHINKGVFITTSSFTRSAIQFIEKQQQKNIKLIDGNLLADLLVKYEVGVAAAQTFKLYSLEHFIVGECGTLHVKTAKYDFPYKYPPTIQKYRNSLFNFIFIPQPLNSSLSNEGLFIKVAEIHTHENEIKCSYSKGYYYITTQGLIILALGRLGEFYCVNPQINMAKSLKGLKKIDWLRNNEACWMNRAIKPNGKINRNEQGIFLTYIQIKRLLSLPVSDEETKKEKSKDGNSQCHIQVSFKYLKISLKKLLCR